jgi:hypothetical protein
LLPIFGATGEIMTRVEIWKDINGYEGVYQASDMGRIKSLKFGKELILKEGTARGYSTIILSEDGDRKGFLSHRVIMEAFKVPNPQNKAQANHIDGDRRNNDLSNLEWVTARENGTHAREVLGVGRSYKLGKSDVLNIHRLYSTGRHTQKEIGGIYNVNYMTIHRVLSGKSYPHLLKEYLEEVGEKQL